MSKERIETMMQVPDNAEQLREAVREHYGKAALQVLGSETVDAGDCCDTSCCSPATGTSSSAKVSMNASSDGCCSSSCCSTATGDPIIGDLYSSEELGNLPVAAALA